MRLPGRRDGSDGVHTVREAARVPARAVDAQAASSRSMSPAHAVSGRGLSDADVERLNAALGIAAGPRSRVVDGRVLWDE